MQQCKTFQPWRSSLVTDEFEFKTSVAETFNIQFISAIYVIAQEFAQSYLRMPYVAKSLYQINIIC